MSAFLDLYRDEQVAKGYLGDKYVQVKTALAERRKKKPKKVNFALRPLKGMSVMMGVAKSACECKECEEKEIKCSECSKCSKQEVAKWSEIKNKQGKVVMSGGYYGDYVVPKGTKATYTQKRKKVLGIIPRKPITRTKVYDKDTTVPILRYKNHATGQNQWVLPSDVPKEGFDRTKVKPLDPKQHENGRRFAEMDKKPVAKGAYSESMEGIQRDRQKANRRRAAGNAFLGGAAVAGTAAAANPAMAQEVVRRAGSKIVVAGGNLSYRGGSEATYEAGPKTYKWRRGKRPEVTLNAEPGRTTHRMEWSNMPESGKPITSPTRTSNAGRKVMSAGFKVIQHPGKAAAGIIGGAALAGAGLKGAGMAHNARSNRNARKYNKLKANSRIKIVPTSGKNRF